MLLYCRKTRRGSGQKAATTAAPTWRRFGLVAGTLACMLVAGQAIAKDTGLVFVSHEKSNNVAVIDPKQDDKIIRWIDTSKRPRDMHFNADHTQILVVCGDDNMIDVIDLASMTVVDHIPTGNSPEMFEFAPDFRSLYVSIEDDAVIQHIDVATKAVLHEVATGAEPEGIAVGEDGRTIYATSEVGDLVHVIDMPTATITDNIVVGTRPRRFAKTPDGKELWVTDELSGEVSIIDRASKSVTQTLRFSLPGLRQEDVTPVGILMSHDGKTAFVTLGRANHIAFVDVPSRTVKDFVLTGARAWGLGESSDGKTLYVTNGLSDDLSIIDIPSRKNVRTLSVGHVPHSVLVDD